MNVLVSLFNSLPGATGQGLIWGIMAIGVSIKAAIIALTTEAFNSDRKSVV